MPKFDERDENPGMSLPANGNKSITAQEIFIQQKTNCDVFQKPTVFLLSRIV